jgi:epoxyqueuosine reductase
MYIGGLGLPCWEDPLYGRTSRLYLSGFFLDVIKPLEKVKHLLIRRGYKALICNSSDSRTSILPLKLAAVRAGLGWQGKNSLLISRKYGTFLALGGVLTNAVLEWNSTKVPNLCGTCNKCQKACPMHALEQPFALNREKCLSYLLQMEHLPAEAQLVMGNRIADCEICQEVCPWNKKHIENPLSTKLTGSFQRKIKQWVKDTYLPDLMDMKEDGYQKKFGLLNTDIPYAVFHRNVLLALGQIKRA